MGRKDITTLAKTLFQSGLVGSETEAKIMAESMQDTSKKIDDHQQENNSSMVVDYGKRRRERANQQEVGKKSQEKIDLQQRQPPQDMSSEKKKQYAEEFRKKALLDNPVNIQVDFDTPGFRQQQEHKNVESEKQYNNKSNVENVKHNEYEKALNRQTNETKQQSFEQKTTVNEPDEHNIESNSAENNNIENNNLFENNKSNKENQITNNNPDEEKPQNSFVSGSLLDQAIQNAKSNPENKKSPEEYSAKGISQSGWPKEQTTQQNNNVSQEQFQEKSENASEREEKEEKPSSRMNEKDKKLQEEVDLTKHFNFTNK
ncbi:MAG: hypothetical protein ACQESC_03605 [Nanobdellota archaeon]